MNWRSSILVFSALLLTSFSSAQRSMRLPEICKFQLDPSNVGVEEKWFSGTFDDTNWKTIRLGSLWEDQGYDYDGYAWYRVKFTLPAEWGNDSVFVVFGGVDDIYDLYLNGTYIASHGDLEKHITVYSTFTSTDLSSIVRRSGENLLAVRVYDWGGGGGIWKQPIALVSEVKPFMPGELFLREAAEKHPDWALPRWSRGKGLAWTMVGIEDGVHEVLRSIDGSFGSTVWPFTISVWLLESDTKELHSPEKLSVSDCQSSLRSGFLPISIYSFPAGGFTVETRLFVDGRSSADRNHARQTRAEGEGVAYCIVRVKAEAGRSSKLKLVVAIRPYLVNPFAGTASTGFVQSIRFDLGSRLAMVNDSIPIIFDGRAERFVTSVLSKEGDISSVLRQAKEGSDTEVRHEVGHAMGAVILPVEFSATKNEWTTAFRIPLQPMKRKADLDRVRMASAAEQEAAVTLFWEERLKSAPRLQLPDKDFENAYYASLAYILISMDKGMLHPGPLAYNYFWYRDGAYMTNALLQAGFANLVKPIMKVFMKPQLASGEFPSIFDLHYKGFGPHEWDAQGQALFTLAQYYRYTRDKPLLKQYWRNVVKAVEFIKSIRAQRLRKEYEGTALYGILPPSVSAEDLGPGTWHHYWDDFWCIKGLYDAAFLARELGEKQMADEFQREATDLFQRTQDSYRTVMKDSSIDWIPNGPEDLRGTSMARGTSPAVWPGQLFTPGDEEIQVSFQRYYEKWIKPFGGAYLHQGHFWPYAFELAQCYAFLGRREITEEILRWHLDHQTYPGVYSWAEQIDTTSLWFHAGDMPHCWVAADYMNALRACLLYEENERIMLGGGVPRTWLKTGRSFSISNAPTFWGTLSYSVSVSRDRKQVSLTLDGTARPPEGYSIRLPLDATTIRSVGVDRGTATIARTGEILVKAGVRRITIKLRTPV